MRSFFIDNVLTVVCKLACRTSIIRGCEVSLLQGTETTSMQSDRVDGTSEEILGHEATVLFPDISINQSVSYRATALTDGSVTEFGAELVGSVVINCKLSNASQLLVLK